MLSSISGQTNRYTEPSSTMTMFSSILRNKPTLDIPPSKEEKKINKIAYVNTQIGAGTPTEAGTIIFKNRIKKPSIKLAKAVSNNSTNYHGEVEALLLHLKYITSLPTPWFQ